ncbi:MAG TPA: sigma-70 family RNA polymerase sigma factor [Pirellulales bacterium]|nr:sigma-70 family RNA polymerase sigma factor [Pirellulales bacterium]
MSETPQPRDLAADKQATSLTLLARLRADEPDAWRTMVGLYTPLVAYWLRRQGAREADVEDLVQEVFTVAAQNMARFRREHEHDTFRGWLRGIARNLVRKHFQRQSKQPQAQGGTDAFHRLQAVSAAANPSIDEEDPVGELSALYRRALELVRSEFEESSWRAFWQTAIENRTPAELSPSLGMSPAAIRKAKSRVLLRLRQQLGDLIE